jgi:hypothetical protein
MRELTIQELDTQLAQQLPARELMCGAPSSHCCCAPPPPPPPPCCCGGISVSVCLKASL